MSRHRNAISKNRIPQSLTSRSQSNFSFQRLTATNMKFSSAVLFLLPAIASAFAPAPRVSRATSSMSAAKSFEEDLEKTRAVIASFMDGRDGSVPAEVEEEPAAEEDEEE